MEIWLDTIDINTISNILEITNITGITTNPSILAESSENGFEKQINKLLSIQNGLVAIQVLGKTSEDMISQALSLYKLFGSRIVIKIPSTYEGFKAMKILTDKKIQILATAVYEEKQVLISGLLGVNYIAPYFSRINSISNNGASNISNMLNLITINKFISKLMIASIKNVEQLININILGAHAVTLPKGLIIDLITDNKNTNTDTCEFNKKFESNEIINKDFHKILYSH